MWLFYQCFILLTIFFLAHARNRQRFNARPNPVLTSPLLTEIADVHNATTARVTLAWMLANNMAAVPRTTDVDHMRDNFAALSLVLSQGERARIDASDDER